jgi:hypothetical protein
MKYVLAHHCDHEEHTGEDHALAYLHEEDEDQARVVKVFENKAEALQYMKDNRWSPNQVMVVPHKEGIWDE